GWSSLPASLASFDADVICLVESKRLEQRRAELEQRLPGYAMHFAAGGFTVLVRGDLLACEPAPMAPSKAVRVAVRCRRTNQELALLLVDMPSNPLSSRQPAFAQLEQLVLRDASAPQVLLGDFNTPRSSVYFDGLREGLRHACEMAGEGFVETWPALFPVLDLDHIWLGPSMSPVRCHYSSAWLSDHLAVVVDAVLVAG